MIKLTWEKINEEAFCQGIRKLGKNTELDNRTSYKVGKLIRVFQKEMNKCQKLIGKLEESYCKKDKKGKKDFKTPEAGEEFNKKLKELMESNEVTINTKKIDFYKVKGLCGTELEAIEDVLKNTPPFEDENEEDDPNPCLN